MCSIRKCILLVRLYKSIVFTCYILYIYQIKHEIRVITNFTKLNFCIVNDVSMPTDKTTCFLCQSILNYVQQVVTDPKSEAEIRTALEKSCLVIPSSFEQQCKQFVDQYGDAFISLVAQEVDPSIVSVQL